MRPPDRIAETIEAAVAAGAFPGAVLFVRLRGQVAYYRAFGLAARLPQAEPADLATVYDLASLTKPLATATAILCLLQEGVLRLDQPVERWLGELKGTPVGPATLTHLLNHSAGLPGWRPFYERVPEAARADPGFRGSAAVCRLVVELIGQEALLYPTGTRSLYSDLGFMLLGLVVERASGIGLAEFCRDRIFVPLGAEPLYFVRTGPGGPIELVGSGPGGRRVAPTEDEGWRGRMLRGEVHDQNCFAMGGVAGHAGLFGTAAAVATVSGAWLQGWLGCDGLLRPDLVRLFTTRRAETPGSSWALGWDTPSAPSSSGRHFSPRSFGHLGYTGTSLWIDPERELEVVLLSNRVHPTSKNQAIQQVRPVIHDVIYEELVG
ncbi:serine hydrolase domain-containing protein [Nitrospira sp. Kam-Ns4a]